MTATERLDKEIVDAATLIAVLLVFVFAYFSAVLPQIEQLRGQPRPAAADDRAALRGRLLGYLFIAFGNAVLNVLVFLLLLPLSLEALGSSPLGPPFSTLRSGLILVELLLLLTASALGYEMLLILRRRSTLRS